MRRFSMIVLAALLISVTGGCDGTTQNQGPTGRVTVSVDQLGLGSVLRPGDFTMVRLSLESGLSEATDVWVQWEIPNADGDIAEYGARTSVTPGGKTRLSLYARIPPTTDQTSLWPVRVFEYRDGQKRGEVGGALVGPNPNVSIAMGQPAIFQDFEAIIGVVGSNDPGLADYGLSGTAIGNQDVHTSHEEIRIVRGIEAQHLPNRWEGLAPLEALVWHEGEPGDLSEPQVDALMEWVRRGGHLAIVLPGATDPWKLKTNEPTYFDPWLPEVSPRETLLSIYDIRTAVCRGDSFESLPRHDAIQIATKVFQDLVAEDEAEPFDVIDGTPFEPLIATDAGEVIVVQRPVEHGRLTLIGFEIDAPLRQGVTLANGLRGVPQADIFWNRILSRRADAPPLGERTSFADRSMLRRANTQLVDLGGGSLFKTKINLEQKATQGLLLAIVLFLAYICVAWASFYVLRRHKRAHLSWLVFAGTSAMFTALAWGGVSAISVNRTQVRHLTFLDAVANVDPDQPATPHRAISWFSAYLPGYGDTTVAIADDEDLRNLLVSWIPPGVERSLFTNVDRYTVDVMNGADRADMPTRSTATQFYAHWMGFVDGQDWGGGFRAVKPPTITMQGDQESRITCDVTHNLQGRISRMIAVWVRNNRVRPARYRRNGDVEFAVRPFTGSGRLSISASAVAFDNTDLRAWTPGSTQTIAIDNKFNNRLDEVFRKQYYEAFQTGSIGLGMPTLSRYTNEYLDMLSFFNLLEPPQYLSEGTSGAEESIVRAQRRLGRELDITGWMNRPCLILIAYLDDSPCPVPLVLDGEAPESQGTTVVRWVYPMDVDEELAFRDLAVMSDEDSE